MTWSSPYPEEFPKKDGSPCHLYPEISPNDGFFIDPKEMDDP